MKGNKQEEQANCTSKNKRGGVEVDIYIDIVNDRRTAMVERVRGEEKTVNGGRAMSVRRYHTTRTGTIPSASENKREKSLFT